MPTTLTTLTALMLVVAAATTFFMLRVVMRERRRSTARVAALEADIYRTTDEDIVVLHDPQAIPFGQPDSEPAAGHAMFATTLASLPIAPLVAVGAAIAVGVALGAWRYNGTTNQPPRQAAAVASSRALELISLDHENADDRLTVRGVVRNPPRAGEVDHLTAVVLLFNQQGGFVTSGRSPVNNTALMPGSEAQFAVTFLGATDVGKYRVSFRTDDRVVPHVDHR